MKENCKKCKNTRYLEALSEAQNKQKLCYERCKNIVTNPSVLQAIASPITQLRNCPVKDCNYK